MKNDQSQLLPGPQELVMLERSAGGHNQESGISLSLFSDVSLKIQPASANSQEYPSSKLQKGLTLVSGGLELSEESVGFGVPILRPGIRTIFPGKIELACREEGTHSQISAMFTMNLEERLSRPGRKNIESRSFYWFKNHMSRLHMSFPPSRGPLTKVSNLLRRNLGWVTTFEDSGSSYPISVNYEIDSQAGAIIIAVDTTGIPKDGETGVFIMNELGANYFDTYTDSSGLVLKDLEIESWAEVTADKAAFHSNRHHLAFTLRQIEGVKLYRGRELIGGRLAWSGFAYSLPSFRHRFSYRLEIEKHP